MARTPSMTVAEAEAAIGKPRGQLFVTADNNKLVRKWLTANGIPGLYAAGLARAALAGIYNDTTNRELERARINAADVSAEDGADDATESSESTETTPDSTESKPFGTSQPVAAKPVAPDMAQALETLRAVFGAQGGGLDADAVRHIIRTELPSLIPVTRLEVVTNGVPKDHGAKPRHKQLPDLLAALMSGCHVAMVGPAGSGKTTAAEQATEIMERAFYLQGAVQGAHELTGYCDATGNYHRTPMREALEHGGNCCLDEMDAGDASGLLVANSATANGYMPFPDSPKPVAVHPNFLVIACLNTYGNGADRVYVGRNQMDGATLDRFVFINWEYDERLEKAIAGNDTWTERVQALRHGATKEKARIIISPRASIKGAKLLAAGLSQSKVEDMVIWRGCDAELRRRIEAHA